jgi:hypothetical protein
VQVPSESLEIVELGADMAVKADAVSVRVADASL